MKYEVLITKVETARVCVEAENTGEAEDIVFERLMRGDIRLEKSDIPGEVSIKVLEPDRAADTITVYWYDLTPAKQAEILATFGDNCNYDVFPIVEIPVSEEFSE